jgi:hypothetical protein
MPDPGPVKLQLTACCYRHYSKQRKKRIQLRDSPNFEALSAHLGEIE